MTLCEYASFDVYFVCIHTRLKTFCILQIIPRCTSRKYYISMFGFSNRPKRIFRGNQEIYFSLCSLCYIRRPRKRKKSDFFLSERAILHDALVECYLLILPYIFLPLLYFSGAIQDSAAPPKVRILSHSFCFLLDMHF